MARILTLDQIEARAAGTLVEHMGLQFDAVTHGRVSGRIDLKPHHLAPNGYLHAGSVITLADTSAGYGCVAHLPAGATGFTTVELKSNHLGTALDGTIECVATAVHLGRTTQVWDAVVSHRESGRRIALFRCTQMVLYGKG